MLTNFYMLNILRTIWYNNKIRWHAPVKMSRGKGRKKYANVVTYLLVLPQFVTLGAYMCTHTINSIRLRESTIQSAAWPPQAQERSTKPRIHNGEYCEAFKQLCALHVVLRKIRIGGVHKLSIAIGRRTLSEFKWHLMRISV
jgi:hypothetical protein